MVSINFINCDYLEKNLKYLRIDKIFTFAFASVLIYKYKEFKLLKIIVFIYQVLFDHVSV